LPQWIRSSEPTPRLRFILMTDTWHVKRCIITIIPIQQTHLNDIKIVFRRGSAPDPAGGANDAPTNLLVPVPHPLDTFGVSTLGASNSTPLASRVRRSPCAHLKRVSIKCGMEDAESMWLVDGNNHVTVHIPQYITSDVATVVNRMRKSHAEIENTTYIYPRESFHEGLWNHRRTLSVCLLHPASNRNRKRTCACFSPQEPSQKISSRSVHVLFSYRGNRQTARQTNVRRWLHNPREAKLSWG